MTSSSYSPQPARRARSLRLPRPIRAVLALLAALLWTCLTLAAQEGAYLVNTETPLSENELRALLPEAFKLFDEDETLELEIVSDFKNLIRKKFQTEYQPATLVYYPNDSVVIRRNIEIKARGNSRRQLCYFPPVMIRFKKTNFVLEDLRELSKMKMVSYCNRGKAYESYLLKEYLTYRILNLLTPISFRPRLIRMTYVDTGRKNKTLESYAFLLEPVKAMEKRLEARELKEVTVHPNATRQDHMAIVDLFEFLIGNYDWSVLKRHNVKILQPTDPSQPKPVAVPYDFDYCGLVDAHYAIPPENLRINSVRDRLYRGFCRTPEAEEAVRQHFLDKKDEIFALIEQFEPMDKKYKKDMRVYLEEGFRMLENPQLFAARVTAVCRTR